MALKFNSRMSKEMKHARCACREYYDISGLIEDINSYGIERWLSIKNIKHEICEGNIYKVFDDSGKLTKIMKADWAGNPLYVKFLDKEGNTNKIVSCVCGKPLISYYDKNGNVTKRLQSDGLYNYVISQQFKDNKLQKEALYSQHFPIHGYTIKREGKEVLKLPPQHVNDSDIVKVNTIRDYKNGKIIEYRKGSMPNKQY